MNKEKLYNTNNAPSLNFLRKELKNIPQNRILKIKEEVDKQMLSKGKK